MTSPLPLSIGSVALVSAVSFIGVFAFVFHERHIRMVLLPLVGFSTGALLGDVFLHILPELADAPDTLAARLLWVLGGILFSFALEKVIHWRHCHCSALPGETAHIHPVGIMNLVGDGLHNLIDGALIAGSYLVSPSIGFATTMAVVFHEIPQEIGDFALLLFSGFTRWRALSLNFLSACVSFVGALAVVFLSTSVLPILSAYLLPLAAGNFLYIAGSDLIPELHRETRFRSTIAQLFCILLGISVMFALTLFE